MLRALLDEEIDRHDRAVDPAFRRRLVASRRLVKAVAGHVLRRPPAQLRLRRDADGRPFLDRGPGRAVRLDMSLGHTGDVLAVAVSRHGRVGVDVEPRRRLAADGAFADRVCHPAEAVALRGLPVEARAEQLTRLWTVKEAYAKALGVGLALDFRTVRAADVHSRTAVVRRHRVTTAYVPAPTADPRRD